MIPLGHMGSKSRLQPGGFLFVQEPSGLIDESGPAQTGDGVNETGTADPFGGFLADYGIVET